eukprot:comp16860_c2_seq1/m.15337 comp16860_c2_seq1/g.15337  ORF comp16860_c2_seq1/g.15337 comp16860_c2_seq1/m.15337 type:complete len:163 (-) comp16860_c2_seq1:289-777(-)
MTWQFGEPRIRLEVLGKYQITTVLGMTYFAVILALLSGIYELRIGTSYRERTGAPCSIEQSHILQKNTGCTTVSGNFEQWTGRLDDWSVLYGAFELLLSVTPSQPLPRDRHLGYTVQLVRVGVVRVHVEKKERGESVVAHTGKHSTEPRRMKRRARGGPYVP